MTITPQDFVSKWKRAEARERQSVQEHFLDLCAMIGHESPMQYDPTGTRFAFEMGAAKTSGGQGWADVVNQRPTWLDLAHQRLDQAVFAAYGWESTLSDEEILERLLKLNLERGR